ncbi:hypothetical protein V6N11_040580 [Hibiscus sabdariffa]|uniref:Cation efflux protein transmembrane domain-containing protein n=1 Tax=Hibiscus sabdariffa TaxID=183260 RepID=A0ABR2RHX1_9ROSI
MADHNHHHHRPNRLSVPPRATGFTTQTTTPRSYPPYSYPSSITTPTASPSKHRLSLQSSIASSSSQKKSPLSILLLLLSLPAMILAELSGNLAGWLFSKEKTPKKSFFVYESKGGGNISIDDLGWPLVNIVVFGVILSENFSDGLLLCGLLLYIAVRELDPAYTSYIELGMESSESFSMSIMKPIQHILSERKSRKIALFLLINTGYMVVEFVAGFMSNSLGLISDACHMLFDCAALAIGLYASYISQLPANSQFNYGRGRFEILSGYANAVFLVLVGALIVLESFERILDPQEISTNSLLTVSIGGLVVNVVGLIFFHEEHHHAHGGSCSHSHSHQHSYDHESHVGHHDLINVFEGCRDSCSSHEHHHSNQHLSNNHHGKDHKKHEFHGHHDHDRSLAPHVIPLLRNSAEILLQRVPRAQEQGLKKAISDITNMKGVYRVHNLHVWSFTNLDIVGTAHLHISAETDRAAMKSRVSHILHDAGIKDLTLQVERVEQ